MDTPKINEVSLHALLPKPKKGEKKKKTFSVSFIEKSRCLPHGN